MKTRDEELDEIIDVVVKLVWTHAAFQSLFSKHPADAEVRCEYPELFLTLHDALVCSFCVAVEILFEEKEKATSLWSLIRKSRPQLSSELTRRIQVHTSAINRIETVRHQVCAHRWQAKLPKDVFAEVQLRLSTMTEIADLARSLILELVGEIDGDKKLELKKQQLGDLTVGCVTGAAGKILQALQLPPFHSQGQ
jgi:hypothetical protein